MHVLAVDSEKMSKSLGNFFTIRDVTQHYHPFVLRWFLLSSSYRAPINYTQRGLEEVCVRPQQAQLLISLLCPTCPHVTAA